jgi:hypothetical protein
MAKENTKQGWANDSLTESFTHTRPDPSTKAPVLKRGNGSNGKPASADKSGEGAKKP